jgi:flagellar assembly protein FliH
MSDLIAKEQLTAYQRWELPTFDITPPVVEVIPTVSLPTAADIEQIQKQAYEESYAEGYAKGAQKARNEEQSACEQTQRLMEIISSLDQEFQQVDQQVAQSLLDLALEVAKQMLHQALKVKPELLLPVINEAINELPHFNQHVHLVLHPSDVEMVRSKMGEQFEHTGWKILEDAKMEPGGCRAETQSSQIDGSLNTRWKRVVSSIGQDNSWLEM